MTQAPTRTVSIALWLGILGLCAAVPLALWSTVVAGVALVLSATVLVPQLRPIRLILPVGGSACLVTVAVAATSGEIGALPLVWSSLLPIILLARQISDAKEREDFAERRAFLHDVRTPLNGMTGIMEIIGLRLRDPEVHRLIEIAKGAGDRLTDILNRESAREMRKRESAQRHPIPPLGRLKVPTRRSALP